MTKKKTEVEIEPIDRDEEELPDNEEFISDDELDIEVFVDENDGSVIVKFTGFDDDEDREEYAQFLVDTLPLLLFETTRVQ